MAYVETKSKLSFKQQKFAQIYKGNATRAALEAGYSPKTAYSQGQRLLKNVGVCDEMKALAVRHSRAKISTKEERQAFWTQVYNDPAVAMEHRLRAAELLGKSEADFTDKLVHVGVHSDQGMEVMFKEWRGRKELPHNEVKSSLEVGHVTHDIT